jgi:hypothetical protein
MHSPYPREWWINKVREGFEADYRAPDDLFERMAKAARPTPERPAIKQQQPRPLCFLNGDDVTTSCYRCYECRNHYN